MPSHLIRHFCLTALLPALSFAAPATAPTTQAAAVHAAYQQALHDLAHNSWEAAGKQPHIRPTRAGNTTPGAADVGTVHGDAKMPSVWQMAQYANILYWNWKLTHSSAAKAQLVNEWAYVRAALGDKMLTSAQRAVHVVIISDDPAWAINYLVQTHEVTGDAAIITAAEVLAAAQD